MAMQYVKVFYDWKEQTAELTDEEFGSLIRALICYANEEEPEELTGAARILFPMFRRFVDWETEAYEKKVKQCREAGKKSGIARKRNEKERARTKVNEMNEEQEQNKEEEEEKEDDYDYKQQNQEKECDLKSGIRDKDWEEYWGDYAMDDYENEMDDDVEKINDFIIEKGLDCDGREFYEYYKKRNWEVGGKRIENWKGLLISWAKNRKCDELSISKAPTKRSSTFDVDDFFEAALNRKFVLPGSKE